MMNTLLLLCCVGAVVSMTVIDRSEVIEDQAWQVWKADHQKVYRDFGEEKVRFTIWQDNFRRVVEHNQKSSDLTLAMNKFGDMTTAEFSAKMTGYRGTKGGEGSTFLAPENVQVPASVDWRTKGLVTPIKDQKQCGSCWAFSAIGSLEGQHAKKSKKLVSLSEQQLVDCSEKFGNLGCNGGLMDNAFQYIKANGIESEADYPYKGKNGKCQYDASKIVTKVTGFTDVPEGDEDALKSALATQGPISVAIDASHMSFQFYHTGVYNERRCSSTRLDHGVLAVGYGTLDGKDYWLVKNSWGPTWGLKGYIMMTRNKKNQCGIASAASYPLL